jgi:hypothetical protein
MDRNVTAALVLAGVGVLGVAGITMALDASESGTTAVVAQAAPVSPDEHSTTEGQGNGWGQGIGQGNGGGQGIGNGRGQGNGNGQGQGNGQGGGYGGGQGTNGSGTHGQGEQQESHAADIPAAVPGAEIDGAVAEELAFMVEEEKLARDLYALAMEAWPEARVFSNINRSESTHMSEVQVLLDRYSVKDPTEGRDPGEFENDSLEDLYKKLAEQVDDSRQAAAQVGVEVEVTDIADLKEAMALDAPADVTAVLSDLLAGSERHLAAFTRNGGTTANV